ncbi:MAG: hypothetical protein PHY16_12450 [Methylobacter sp.]|nr:hypothetical protein [Methylobacter sp.]
MIAPEIVLTLVATLLTTLVAIFLIQRSALLRAKLTHRLEIMELAKRLNCDEANFKNLIKKRFESSDIEKDRSFITSAKLLGKIIFGIVVFIGFTWWTLYLIEQGYAQWAVVSGIFAFIGTVIPFIVWIGYKQRSEATHQLMDDINSYEKAISEKKLSMKTEKVPDVQVEQLVMVDIPPEAIPVAEIAAEIPPEGVTVAETVVIQTKVENEYYQQSEKKQKIPQDSVLRRHYLTHLRTEIESGLTACPTDSVLRRHYNHLINTEMEKQLEELDA